MIRLYVCLSVHDDHTAPFPPPRQVSPRVLSTRTVYWTSSVPVTPWSFTSQWIPQGLLTSPDGRMADCRGFSICRPGTFPSITMCPLSLRLCIHDSFPCSFSWELVLRRTSGPCRHLDDCPPPGSGRASETGIVGVFVQVS